MSREEDRGNYEERIQNRKALKNRLLVYFGSGLVSNFINLSSFMIGGFVYKQYFVEILVISGCALTAYLILNLYFLDVLRDGVLSPIANSLEKKRNRAIVNEVVEVGIIELVEVESHVRERK
jgi:hypothetical protein